MNEPQDHEMTPGQGLTTEQLAKAGEPPAAPAEPRTFEGDRPQGAPQAEAEGRDQPLFAQDEAGDLRGRWGHIQTGFVDEPRRAVEEADQLVAQTMKRLAERSAARSGSAIPRSLSSKQHDAERRRQDRARDRLAVDERTECETRCGLVRELHAAQRVAALRIDHQGFLEARTVRDDDRRSRCA